MLVLSRKPNEVIHIGDNITVTVVECRGNRVRLAISAPREMPIHRSEVYRKLAAEEAMQSAAATTGELQSVVAS